jgi:hypothetical protein
MHVCRHISFREFCDASDRYPSLVPWIGLLDEDDGGGDDPVSTPLLRAAIAPAGVPATRPIASASAGAGAGAVRNIPIITDEKKAAPPRAVASAVASDSKRSAAPAPYDPYRAAYDDDDQVDDDDDVSGAEDAAVGGSGAGGRGSAASDAGDSTAGDPAAVMYVLPLTETKSLELRKADMEDLFLLQETIGAQGTERLMQVFGKFMNDRGLLDEVAFTRACEYLIPPAQLAGQRRHLLQFLLATMFSLYGKAFNTHGSYPMLKCCKQSPHCCPRCRVVCCAVLCCVFRCRQ